MHVELTVEVADQLRIARAGVMLHRVAEVSRGENGPDCAV